MYSNSIELDKEVDPSRDIWPKKKSIQFQMGDIFRNGKPDSSTRSVPVSTLQPIYVAEPLEVNEGGSMPLQWKNIYILPEHSRFNVSNKQITFSIVEGPHHGTLVLDGQPCAAFDYSQLLSRSVIYRHDGSETTQDQMEFQLDINGKKTDFPWLDATTYMLRIRINPVNDPPELLGTKGVHVIKISAKGSRTLTSEHILLSDPDDGPDKVRVQVVEARGVHLRVGNTTATEFTQRQFIKRLVSIHDEGLFEKGILRLVARDGDARSQVESGEFVSMIHNFRLMFIPMNVKVFNREVFMLNGTETGTLNRANLFAWTFPKSYPPEKLVYHIEEPPKYGILSRKINGKSRRIGVSSNFTQADIDNKVISFKLHFMQYSIINDFFLFRVITPAISSESLRFEITQDSLSLATPDDSFFIFTLALAPLHGSLVLRTSNSTNRTLSTGMNFTTRDIAEERLIYSHSGSESRTDRLHLIAESAFRKGRRIPFWMSFSIIPINDNRPRLRGSHVIQIVERGERVLHPDLLDWVDDDHDGVAPLVFNFYQPIKDAAVLSTVSPYLPMTTFTEQDLINGKVMVRHLGHKNNFTVSYTVSDKKHTVEGLLRIVASDPFVRIGESLLEYCCLPGDTPNLHVSPANLSVVTNLDVRPDDIVYQSQSDSFVMQYQKYRRPVRTFTQKDINDGKISYNVHSAVTEVLTVRVRNRTLKAEVQILRRSLGASLELRRSSTIALPVGGVASIDSNHLEIGDAASAADDLVYNIIKQPQEGALVLERENTTATPSIVVRRFSQRDVDLGRVQYIHSGSGSGRDTIQFNISSPHSTKGPYTLYVEIYEHHVSLTSALLNVVAGGSTVISSSVLNVTSSDREDYVVNVVEKPNYGWIVLDSWSTNNITSIESFSGADLRERRVVYVSDRDSPATRDSFSVAVCISHHTCTQTQIVDVTISQRNVQSPQLLRNEILRVNSETTPITNAHLDTEDPDTPPSGVFFLISKPSNGMVVNVNDLSKDIYNFSQKEIDDSSIVFLRQGSTFIKESSRIRPARVDSHFFSQMEFIKLVPSGSQSKAGQARPEQILFSVSRPPKYGKLLVGSNETGKFSQLDVNRNRLVYQPSGAPQKEWTRKDSFYFVLQKNGSDKPIEEEFRFRIASTYAALHDPTESYVKTSPLNISKGSKSATMCAFRIIVGFADLVCFTGGSAALTKDHLDASILASSAENEKLILEVSTPPRYGVLEFLDGAGASMHWSEFQSEPKLIYRNGGEESRDDSVTFFIYPASERTRRSSRLRITVPIHIRTPRDPLVQVSRFPTSISVRNSGVVPLTAKLFHASHPHVPAQSIVYELTHPGTAGTEIRVSGQKKTMFSQQQVNEGLVSIGHIPSSMVMTSYDVVTLSVEGHSRALVVKIKPLDLALENHTVIEYPQGKTYVLLNQSHLGAYSNGDRSAITYKITSGPENGTFYWVAGEKEAKLFTQKDIDDGKILYAQLNMHSYKDSFEFLLANSEKGVVRNRSEIRVKSLVTAQPGSTPRFLVTATPRYGRISLDPVLNHSALFFTFPDILRGRVYYQAFATDREVTEELELEVRADSVQPARLILPITIIPTDVDVQERTEKEKTPDDKRKQSKFPKSRLIPASDQLPVIVLVLVLFITVFVLLCRRKRPKPKSDTPQEQQTPTPKTSLQEKPDLLGSTVFASVGKSDMSPRQPMRTFERPQVTPLSKRRHQPSLDYAGLATDTPPPMPLFKQLTAQRSDAQHWV
ncbi:hypothetical protein TELCIR_00118 [Teladorsagia circumcincta]|uniref:Chondroitin sulfate proteoglycan 4 n=1 Tax=Teladorsagia circumcincta TaxID=45464 RepID=A0A2G9V5J2_TELCI|nr:hypothetical protein TELCIR_00118 [Teladorsagia circumcincta]